MTAPNPDSFCLAGEVCKVRLNHYHHVLTHLYQFIVPSAVWVDRMRSRSMLMSVCDVLIPHSKVNCTININYFHYPVSDGAATRSDRKSSRAGVRFALAH